MRLLVYGLILILIILSVVIYMLGLSKIIKLLLGNYIVATLIFSLYKSINIAIQNATAIGVETMLGIKTTVWIDILSFGRIPLLILYILGLLLVYKISKISIVYPRGFLVQKTIKLIYAPLTALSIFFTLWLMISAMGILNSTTMEAIFNSNRYLNSVLQNIWVGVFFHTIIVLLITSRINVIGFKNKDFTPDSMLP